MKRQAGMAAVAAAMLAGVVAGADEPREVSFSSDEFRVDFPQESTKNAMISIEALPDHQFRIKLNVLEDKGGRFKSMGTVILQATDDLKVRFRSDNLTETGVKTAFDIEAESMRFGVESPDRDLKLQINGRGKVKGQVHKSNLPKPAEK